jgi:hypothetical protein
MDGSRKAVHCYCTEKLKWVDVYNQIIHTANAFESESHSEVGTWSHHLSTSGLLSSFSYLAGLHVYLLYIQICCCKASYMGDNVFFFFIFLNLHHIEIFFCIGFVCYIMQNVHMFSHFWATWRSLILPPYHVRDNSSLLIKLTLILITLNISAPVPRCIKIYPLCITSPVVKQPGHGVNHPSLSSAKVEERVDNIIDT